MTSIIVKHSDSKTSMYISGELFKINEDGSSERVERTSEEELQSCYHSLINDIKRGEFEKIIRHVVLSYLGWEEKDCDNIKIEIDGGGGKCEMNIRMSNDKNIDNNKS